MYSSGGFERASGFVDVFRQKLAAQRGAGSGTNSRNIQLGHVSPNKVSKLKDTSDVCVVHTKPPGAHYLNLRASFNSANKAAKSGYNYIHNTF